MKVSAGSHVGRRAWRIFTWAQLALALVVAVVGFAAVGCGGKSNLPVQGVSDEALAAQHSKASSRGSARERPEVESSFIAAVPERTLGPFLVRHDGAAMVAYLAPDSGGRKVVAAALSEHGKLTGSSRVVATAKGDVETLVLRATGGNRPGFVALWTSLTERGEAIELVGIGDDGAPRGQSIEVARTNDNVVWVEAVKTPRGAVCVWAEETRDQSVNILAVALDPDGRPRGVPTPIAKGAIGWQAVPTTMGVGLALVIRDKAPSLVWMKLDGDARAIGVPETIARAVVGTDVDVVRVGDSWLFAWTDRSGFDPQILTASLDDRAGSGDKHAVRAPVPAVTAIGGAKLVGLVSTGNAAALAWDESSRARSGRLHISKVEASGNVVPNASIILDLQSDVAPTLAPAGRGVALLVHARPCPISDASAACSALDPVPMFVRLDEKLAPVQVEALRMREQRVAGIAWGLDCRGDCVALAAIPGPTTQVHSVHLSARASAYKAPILPPPPADAPRPTTLTTLAAREPFTDLAAARVGESTLLAVIASPPAPEPKRKGAAPAPPSTGDTIRLREIDAKGTPLEKPSVLTNRALSVGGVAIAAGASPEDGAAVAWVARDNGDPQVHVARVDRHGKKLREQQITTDRGEASDVAIGWVQNGWIVAWVDGRDGNGEVYAARLSPELRVVSSERVTKAPGDASDLTMLVQGDRVWLAFADPRDSPHDGFADVYVAILRAADAKRVEEARVLSSAAHSRSPVLAPLAGTSGGGVAVGWIEETPMGTEPNNSAAYGAMVAWLDPKASSIREPIRTGGSGPGFPTAIAFEARGAETRGPLRAIVARSTRDDLWLDALEFPPQAAPVKAFPLLALSGPPSLDVSLAFLGGALFYNDGLPEEERIRRLTVGWK